MPADDVFTTDRYRRLRRSILAGLLGSGAALLVVVLGLMWWLYGGLPALTGSSLAAAEQKWNQRGFPDYDLVLKINGQRSGEVRISVRNGVPVAMTRDGVTPEQRRTWDAWTIPSMFDTLHTELEAAQHPAQGYGAPADATVTLRARFDPTFGYPAQFERNVLGAELGMGWEVTEFQPWQAGSFVDQSGDGARP